MNHVARVRVLQSSGDIENNVNGIAHRHMVELVDQAQNAGTIDKLQDQVVDTGRAILPGGVIADDIRMIEQRAALGLTVKAIERQLFLGQILRQNLDSDLAVL